MLLEKQSKVGVGGPQCRASVTVSDGDVGVRRPADGVHGVALIGAVGALIGQRGHLVLAGRGGGVVLGGVESLRASW